MRRPCSALLCCIFFCLSFCNLASAQTAISGAISGVVYDSRGDKLFGATITVRNEATDSTNHSVSDGHGFYRIEALDPGNYTVFIRSGTAAQFTSEHVLVEVGQVADVSAQISSIVVRSEIRVVDRSPEINQSGPELSTNIHPDSVENLPANARRWSSFALLTPTAVPDGAYGDISFRGISGLQNNNTIDGADSNQAMFSEEAGRTRVEYLVSEASVREFQVNTSNYSAEYGRAAGAVINTVTRHGGNRLHGEAFYVDRDSEWAARNPFTFLTLPNPDGTTSEQSYKLPDVRRQWGIATGGPILKERLFWFYTYDQERRNFPGLATVTSAPTYFFSRAQAADSGSQNPVGSTCLAETTGANKSTGSEQLPTLYGTQGACFLAADDPVLYPTYASAAAAYNNGLSYIDSLLGIAPRTNDQIINFPKLDWKINERNYATVQYNRMRWQSPAGVQSQPFANYAVTSFGNDFVKVDSGALKLNSFLTPNLDNELRAGYQRDFEYETAQSSLPQEPLTANGGTAPPGITIGNQLHLGTPNSLPRAAYPNERRTQGADTLAWVHRKHVLHVGGDFNHVQDLILNLYSQAGSYYYTNVQNFLIDVASQNAVPAKHCGAAGNSLCYSNYTQGFGVPGFQFWTNDFAGFFQDDWRMSSRLLFNIGLRYEYQQLPQPAIPNAALPATATFPSDDNNVGPRIGFVFDPIGRGRTIVRGGYGIYFGRLINGEIFTALTNTGNPGGQVDYTLSSGAAAPHYPQTLAYPPATTLASPNVTIFSKRFQNPAIQQADFEIEHDLGWNTMISASYLLSLGRDLAAVTDSNLNPPTSSVSYAFSGGGPLDGRTATFPLFTGVRPNPAFGAIYTIASQVNSSYNALVIQAKHRMHRGVEFQTHYTYSHAIDFNQQSASSATYTTVFDPFDSHYDKGTSDFDRRQVVSGSLILQSPFSAQNRIFQDIIKDWTAATTFRMSTGAPYSAVLTGNAPGYSSSDRTSTGFIGAGGANFIPTLGRNSYQQPGIESTNLRLSRTFSIRERFRLEALAESFNIFNHENVTGTSSGVGVNTVAYSIGTGQPAGQTASAVYQPTFGQIQSANSSAFFSQREIELALRLHF